MAKNDAQRQRGNGENPPAWNAQAFATRYQAAYRALWVLAAGLVGDRSAADDIVQEAAVSALGKLQQFDPDMPGSSFPAWMAQFVRYVANNYNRRQHHRQAAPLDALDPAAATDRSPMRTENPPTALTAAGKLPLDQPHFDDRVMAGLAAINQTARACLLLRIIEGLEYSEIARLLDIPEGTAMSHVHRARQSLREMLSEKPSHPVTTRPTP